MKKLLFLIPLLVLVSCNQEISKTPKQWCVDEVKEEFAFDFDGQNGIAFVREADEYFVDTQPENPVYAYLIDIVHEGVPDAVISEYFAWIEAKDLDWGVLPPFPEGNEEPKIHEADIIDIGAELIERDNGLVEMNLKGGKQAL